MLLSGVLAKIGTYGIIRFDLSLFPQATRTLAPLVLTLAVIGIIYGAVVACAAARPEATGDLLVAGADRLHRARHHRPQHARASPAACCSC